MVYLAALTRRSDHAPGSALPRLAALARLAPLALLLLLAAGRGSEQGRRSMLRNLSEEHAIFAPQDFHFDRHETGGLELFFSR